MLEEQLAHLNRAMGKERRRASMTQIEEVKTMVSKLKEANTETKKWTTTDGDYKTLSYEKM